MRRVLLIVVFAACGPDVYAYADFNYDGSGWGLEGQTIEARPTLDKTHGDPSGDICASDNGDVLTEDRPWRFIAPPSYAGDASRFYGRSVTWEAYTNASDGVILTDKDAIFIYAADAGIAAAPDNHAVARPLEWTKLSVSLDTSTVWHFDSADGGPLATQDDIQRVLANITGFRIRGEWNRVAEQSCIDNIFVGIR